ncbi:hypothetical protein A1O7_03380 [Cladophialophora yegresii CBS 114405]|uniref:SET domain-containing protein n=1 Tax=Cladophialophora yegresii CBS 114405 TaxID=1182544 RepID=W9WEE2_9EURO|nr:uncharacterized protein A1O7_03380 [Cladophialophora yegresii CBS 114405]EXJ62936.1 hypothetical protein A1O7_03380 [Cladophialophora yegresii CBS 114405]
MSNNDAVLEGGQPLSRTAGLVLVMNTPKVVEVSPVLIFPEDEVEKHVQHTVLQHYTYYWPSESGRSMTQALALGLGSMFNHSTRDQNVGWIRNTETEVIVYTTLRDIKAGEELCISYGSARLWFPDADAQANTSEGLGDDNDDTGGSTLAELDLSGLSKMDI